MINGAHMVLGDISSGNLDPFLLIKSQRDQLHGFVAIAHIKHTESQSTFYDLLFFHGSSILDSARINQDLRFHCRLDVVTEAFTTARDANACSLYLFVADEPTIARFRSTFYYEPCLKVHLQTLGRKQIASLLATSRCRNGIIECNQFTDKQPRIQLANVHSEEDLSEFVPMFKGGRLLLYDIEKNREIILTRFPENEPAESINNPQLCSQNPIPAVVIEHRSDQPKTSLPACRTTNEEADEFSTFIKQILSSPMSAQQKAPANISAADPIPAPSTRPFIVVKSPTAQYGDIENHNQNITLPQTQKPANMTPLRRRKRATEELSKPFAPANKQDAEQLPIATGANNSEYILMFDRLLRSFRMLLFNSCGDQAERRLSVANQSVSIRLPDFDSDQLNESTAHIVLNLLEETLNAVPLLKRSRLRRATVTLISDLYNKYYNLLEDHHVIDEVEQVYYRLKR
jgi:hypothetical protein